MLWFRIGNKFGANCIEPILSCAMNNSTEELQMSLKRLIDILVCSVGVIVAAPIMLAIAATLKLESRGPVLYTCKRIGRFGCHFEMFKFRTMLDNADIIDCKLCVNSDVRVTRFGRFLRRTKLNELPQLFNVIKGDMSLVGPRPEDPKFMKHNEDQWDIVLSVRPGIMGPNQIAHRNEEDMFSACEDPETFYLTNILPDKLQRDIDYVLNRSTWRDLVLLLGGLYVSIFRGNLLSGIVCRRQCLRQLLTDTGLSVIAYIVAYYMRFDTLSLHSGNLYSFLIIVAANPTIFLLVGLYDRSSRFFSTPDLWLIVKVVVLAAAVLIAASAFVPPLQHSSRTVFLLYPLILLGCLVGFRIAQQLMLEEMERKPLECQGAQNVIIYGAGRLGVETAKRLQFEAGVNIVGFVDDNPSMRNQQLLGMRIMGGSNDLAALKRLHQIDKVFIAFNPRSRNALDLARQRCIQSGLNNVLIRSDIPARPGKEFSRRNYFRGVRLSDTLGICETRLHKHELRSFLKGAAVAIVGAGNNLGEQLCRELLRLDISKLIVIEECPARLSKLTDLFNSIHPMSVSFVPYFHPIGLHEITEEALKAHDVRWLIYNRINRPTTAASLNLQTLILTNFVDVMRYIEMSRRLKWGYFTYLSPYLKDCFSPTEKSLHLLTENYVAFAARSMTTSSATIQVPNVLENENELFMTVCDKALHETPGQLSNEKLTFTSSRYAARMILNSLLLHNRGDTFTFADGLSADLKTLLDVCFQKERNEQPLSNSDCCGPGNGDQLYSRLTSASPRYSETCDEAIVRLQDLELANPDDHEWLIRSVGRHLSHDERIVADRFLSFLRYESSRQLSSPLPSHKAGALSHSLLTNVIIEPINEISHNRPPQ